MNSPEAMIKTQLLNTPLYDYSEIFRLHDVSYTPAGFYWQIGKIKNKQGWVLHLSVIRAQIAQLLNLILPELTHHSLAFRVLRDYSIAGSFLDGSMGIVNIGKIVSVFPESDQQAVIWARRLIELTSKFRGPVIFTDLHLGSIVYARYEAFTQDSANALDQREVKYIYDQKGQKVPDLYTIPYMLPKDIPYPFADIVPSTTPKKGKLLNNIYYPLSILKSDAKGDVMRGIYFKKIWKIQLCLIKQGRFNMFADDHSRDIQDRLAWQFQLYKDLSKDIPMPPIFDFFQHGQDKYLVMQFIKGSSLAHWLYSLYQNRSWNDLPMPFKKKFLDILIEIISIIERLHQRGFIHRDITPENFIIDKKGKIHLIDMELTWHSISGHPDPPFRLGTPGFMSYEQLNTMTPTIKEDVFGIGGLMIVFFTNLTPVKFNTFLYPNLQKQLNFFIGESIIGTLITECLSRSPVDRPQIIDIRRVLENYREILKSCPNMIHFQGSYANHTQDVDYIIKAGLRGLASGVFLSPKKRWASKAQTQLPQFGNDQINLTLYQGWHTGIAGPLWLVAKAKNAGYDVSLSQMAFDASWEYIFENLSQNGSSFESGLYFGSSGVALALSESLYSGLLSFNSIRVENLYTFFSTTSKQPTLSHGWAGEGIALLNCAEWLDKNFVKQRLEDYCFKIINSQLTDGAWEIQQLNSPKGDNFFALSNGVSGILWFLLSYFERFPNKDVEDTVRRGLNWLIQKSNKKKDIYNWGLSNKNPTSVEWDTERGLLGILLVLTKAYEVLQDPIYREIAEKRLHEIHPRPVLMNFTLGTGLAGLGELYLEAFRVFDNQEWLERAGWVAQVFIHSFQEIEEGAGCWIIKTDLVLTADLFNGNSGILYFLLHYLKKNEFTHPLSPRR